MRISKAKLHQIIKEEVASLTEAPAPPTVFARRRSPQQRRRDRDREAVKDFFGADDPLVTKAQPTKPPSDLDQTVVLDADDLAARAAAQDVAEPKQATERHLGDPKRISITSFDSDVRAKLLDTYTKETGTEIDKTALGQGEFGIVYGGENPEYGSVAVKVTLSGQEMNAYKKIKKLKDSLESQDPEAGNVLPTILDIRTLVSVPVGPEGTVRPGKYVEKEGGRPYKVFIIQMELLEKLDPEVRLDVFGLDPTQEDYSPEVRKRFVEEYLTIQNIYSSLEQIFDDIRWEKLIDQVEANTVNEGPTGRSIDLQSSPTAALPIKDERLFPPFREIDKRLPRLRKAYLDAPANVQVYALHDIHDHLKNIIMKAFAKYVEDESVLDQLDIYTGYLLRKQMTANAKLPQYDPEAIEALPGLRARILPPSEIQSRVAKNFYKRLKKLEKWDAQYGDVHANNLMQRPSGDLVVADVGLFLFGPRGGRRHARSITERFKRLAGLI